MGLPWIHYLGPFSILENYKLDRIVDLYKALHEKSKHSMKYLKYNTIKSFYAKSTMTERKDEKECHFIRDKT